MRRVMVTKYEVTTADGSTWHGDCAVWAAGFPSSATIRSRRTMVLTGQRRHHPRHLASCGEVH